MRITRRQFLRYGMAAGALAVAPWPASADVHVRRLGLRKYLEPLPVPGSGIVVARPSATNHYAFTQRQIARRLHPELPPTEFWAYDDGFGLSDQAGSFGMAVVAEVGSPLRISYTNALPATYPGWLPVDTRLTPLGDQVRVMTHLHGGFVAAESDGNPAVTPNGFGQGETQSVIYPNQAPQTAAAMLWFHDHGLGATRLNVAAGLAAAYIVRDHLDTGTEPNPIGIPGGPYEVPLVVQDRRFNPDGTLLYPTSDIAGVTWIGEYFGDVMLVNGKVWPFLDVEPRLYRLRILNGCNARILNLSIPGAAMWQIGAEGGMWDRPVSTRRVLLAPAERADLLVDFSALANGVTHILNTTPTPPVSTPAPPLPDVMQIRVGTQVTRRGPDAIPAHLPGRAAQLANPVRTRWITLNEVAAETAAWHLNLDAQRFGDPATETPAVGTVEDWVYVNLTGDTHPIHTHLVTFQVIGRTPFDVDAYQAEHGGPEGVPGGIDPTPFATGPMLPASPDERGYKDTVKAHPGQLTRIRAKFELPTGVTTPQTYVYHCHILEHEDNDMMRPYTVTD
jgi:spore coat protein A, manganese oxidase